MVVTEPEHSGDLSTAGGAGGCPAAGLLPAGARCEVRSDGVLADLLMLVHSDVRALLP